MTKATTEIEQTDPLAKLREPFPPHQISKLPKETKKQAEQRKAEQEKGNWPAQCSVCQGYHHPKAVHLDYVGHAALTDRLLDTDPHWSWEPVAFRDGLPAFDQSGGLWIKLTVRGVTRLGYGHAATKPGMDPGAREKEAIGDALRNAGMRFGAALDLWHKGDLHVSDEAEEPKEAPRQGKREEPRDDGPSAIEVAAIRLLTDQTDPDVFKEVWAKNKDGWKENFDPPAYGRIVAVMKQVAEKFQRRAAAQQRTDDLGIAANEIPF